MLNLLPVAGIGIAVLILIIVDIRQDLKDRR